MGTRERGCDGHPLERVLARPVEEQDRSSRAAFEHGGGDPRQAERPLGEAGGSEEPRAGGTGGTGRAAILQRR